MAAHKPFCICSISQPPSTAPHTSLQSLDISTKLIIIQKNKQINKNSETKIVSERKVDVQKKTHKLKRNERDYKEKLTEATTPTYAC